jgi:hypothetical protein
MAYRWWWLPCTPAGLPHCAEVRRSGVGGGVLVTKRNLSLSCWPRGRSLPVLGCPLAPPAPLSVDVASACIPCAAVVLPLLMPWWCGSVRQRHRSGRGPWGGDCVSRRFGSPPNRTTPKRAPWVAPRPKKRWWPPKKSRPPETPEIPSFLLGGSTALGGPSEVPWGVSMPARVQSGLARAAVGCRDAVLGGFACRVRARLRLRAPPGSALRACVAFGSFVLAGGMGDDGCVRLGGWGNSRPLGPGHGQPGVASRSPTCKRTKSVFQSTARGPT